MNMTTNVDIMLEKTRQRRRCSGMSGAHAQPEPLSIGDARDVLEFIRQRRTRGGGISFVGDPWEWEPLLLLPDAGASFFSGEG